jgi:hypothetical protein
MSSKELRQEMAEVTDCNQGPVLERIVSKLGILDEHAKDQKVFQRDMSNAIVTIAQQQEKLVAIADKTDQNKNDIDNLFKINRETEKRLNGHIESAGHSPQGDSSNAVKASNYDKIQVSLITSAILGAAAVVYKFIEKVIDYTGGVSP